MALGDQVWRELNTDIDMAAPWHAQMRSLLESLLHVLRSHPCASQVILEGEKQNDAALVAIETALDVLRRGGFDPEQAAEIARSALWTGLMLVMSEGFKPGLTDAERTEEQRLARVRRTAPPTASRELSRPRSRCRRAHPTSTTSSALTSSSRAGGDGARAVTAAPGR